MPPTGGISKTASGYTATATMVTLVPIWSPNHRPAIDLARGQLWRRSGMSGGGAWPASLFPETCRQITVPWRRTTPRLGIQPGQPRAVARRYAAVHLDYAIDPHHRTGMKRPSVAFRLSKQQLAERNALAADIREKTKVLNAAIAAFNQAIEPLSRTVIEAQDDYNAILEKARALASGVTEAARDEFDARSERWQGSDKGIKVRIWIEQWEVSLDDIDLEVPEPLTEIDPEEHAVEIEDAPSGPME